VRHVSRGLKILAGELQCPVIALAVADALQQGGYEVAPQVGFAGYFIDLGISYCELGSEFIAGIECGDLSQRPVDT
jgi:hypothetical protein